MKSQMRFQKILMLVSLIIAAFSVVFALIFCSGVLRELAVYKEFEVDAYIGTQRYAEGITALDAASQSFCDLFLTLGIILVLVVVLMYIMACQKRRNYYITNYVAIGIAVVYMLVYAILLFVSVSGVQAALNNVNIDACKYINLNILGNMEWTVDENPWMLYLGYALAVIILVNAAVLVLNLVWKIKLMQGEKKLLQSGLQLKEVA